MKHFEWTTKHAISGLSVQNEQEGTILLGSLLLSAIEALYGMAMALKSRFRLRYEKERLQEAMAAFNRLFQAMGDYYDESLVADEEMRDAATKTIRFSGNPYARHANSIYNWNMICETVPMAGRHPARPKCTPEYLWKIRQRGEEMLQNAYRQKGKSEDEIEQLITDELLDQPHCEHLDDCYSTLDGPYPDHRHPPVAEAFAFHFPVPNYMRRRLEGYLKSMDKHCAND